MGGSEERAADHLYAYPEALQERLLAIGYRYVSELRQFRPLSAAV